MNLLTIAIILSIVLAFVFTFLNGMNDAANSISTIIATKVMTPVLSYPPSSVQPSGWPYAPRAACLFLPPTPLSAVSLGRHGSSTAVRCYT